MQEVAYITRKVFADDSIELRIKLNKQITAQTILKAQRTRALNKTKRILRNERIKTEILKLNFLDHLYSRKRRKLEYELRLSNLQNMCRSASRSRQALYDICRCNDFDFFVTFTYDNEKIDRYNDRQVKRKFTQWINDTRKKFPNMFYVAVPEYHKKGALHFHLLVGGVTFEELKCVPARNKRGRLIFKKGKQIFNVTAWKWGYSTLSIIENKEASKHYICKYISKQHYDDRFFNKRRYYTSYNIRRPEIEKQCVSVERCLDGIDDNVFAVEYLDSKMNYVVLSHDGNGIVREEMNAPTVKDHFRQLRSAAILRRLRLRLCEVVDGRLADRHDSAQARVRYSTLRTLDRTPVLSECEIECESVEYGYDPYEIGLLDD